MTAAWTVVFFLTEVLACGRDPSAAWRSLYALRHECMDTFSMMTACGMISWFLDLAILVEPILVVSAKLMDLTHKSYTSDFADFDSQNGRLNNST